MRVSLWSGHQYLGSTLVNVLCRLWLQSRTMVPSVSAGKRRQFGRCKEVETYLYTVYAGNHQKASTGHPSQTEQINSLFTLEFIPAGNSEPPFLLTCTCMNCGHKTNNRSTYTQMRQHRQRSRGQESKTISWAVKQRCCERIPAQCHN